jgi:hypothetical protein
MAPSHNTSGNSFLTERAMKRKLDGIIKSAVLRLPTFIPANAALPIKNWLNRLKLTAEERKLALRFVEETLTTYTRRIYFLHQELRQSIEKE